MICFTRFKDATKTKIKLAKPENVDNDDGSDSDCNVELSPKSSTPKDLVITNTA